MITKTNRQTLSSVMSLTLLLLGASGQPSLAFQDPAQPQTSSPSASSSAAPSAAPLTPDQLGALVAPIALYPDALVAQVLGAATFPDQVAIADYWVAENKSLTGAALATAVDQQSWDASVKALTQFPSVLHDLAQNLSWTSSLGQAFHDQQADVMAAVQAMRAKAQAAGTLQTTPQVKVVQQNPQTIVIQPADPQVVYVPQYNPAIVYGSPTVVPLYTPPVAVVGAAVSFGAGVAIGAAFGGGVGVGIVGGGGGFAWGFHSWNVNWGGGGGGGGGNIIYHNNTYITNNNWHSGYYNGYHPWGPGPHGPGPYGPHPYGPNNYGPHPNGYGPHPYTPDGGRNGDRGLIGGNGGTQHPPDGGRNGDHGLIGGNGGTQHPGGMERASNDPQSRDAGANGQHPGERPGQGSNDRPGQRPDSGGRPAWQDQPRSHMSGNGPRTQAESNRGRSSMNRAPHPQSHPAPHPQAPHNNGGEHRK
jgi:hypothetical protein